MNHSLLPRTTRTLRIILFTTVASLSLGGCASSLYQNRPLPEAASARSAAKAVKHGHYIVGSQAYQHLAHQSTGTTKAAYTLKAVEALIRAGALKTAHQELMQVKGPLPASLRAYKDVLQAEIAAALGAPDKAYQETRAAERIPALRPGLLAEIKRIQAQAHMSLGHPYAAAQDLVARENLLVSPRQLYNNETALWHALTALPRARLREISQKTNTDTLKAWVELALIAKRYPPHSQRLQAAVQQWQQQHTKESVTPDFISSLLGAQSQPVGAPRKIALLLPLSSPFAQAAKAVKRGFVDMARAHPAADNPTLYIYDIGADPTQASHYYKEAVAQGAQFIIGPLGAKAVRNVVRHADFTVPTLLLGLAPGGLARDPAKTPVYQFSLARTSEARQAADRAYLDGHTRAAILYPDSAFGARMRQAFARRWRHLGGLVVADGSYTPGANEFVQPVEKLLDITESRARTARLQKILHIPLTVTARRRQDIGCIFLVADAPDARLLKPQLNYDHADTLPVYSISSVFTGRSDPVYDRDLDGITFGDMPWMLVGNGRMKRLRATLPHAQRYDFTPLARLYAFGADADGLVDRLDRLSLGGGRYNGLTGALSVKRDDVIRRHLVWAQFTKGLPVLIDRFLPYRSLFAPKTGHH